MTSSTLPPLDALPVLKISDANAEWVEIVRTVRQHGGLAITSEAEEKVVVLTAATYDALLDRIGSVSSRGRLQPIGRSTELEALSEEFKARLSVLQCPDAHERFDQVFAAKGKLRKPRKVGEI